MATEPSAESRRSLCCRRASSHKDHKAHAAFVSPICLVLALATIPAIAGAAVRRPVTVSDVVNATRVAGPADSSSFLGGAPTKGFASFSPNHRWFGIVLRRANIENNTNVYSLFVMDVDGLPAVNPVPLVTFSSSSNREGIKQVTWLDDNETVLFLGEHPGELTQLYKVSRKTRKLLRITIHPTSVTSYSASVDGSRIVYAAEPRTRVLMTEDVLRHGFHVPSDVDLVGLIAGRVLEGNSDGCELFVLTAGGGYQPLKVTGSLLFPASQMSLSPDGRYLAVMTLTHNIDPTWKEYEDAGLKRALAATMTSSGVKFVRGYELVNLKDGTSKPLIDAPVGDSGSELMWSPDSQSVIVTGMHLPLISNDSGISRDRRIHTFVVEVSVRGGRINEITDQDLELVAFDREGYVWKFEMRHDQIKINGGPKLFYFRKTPQGWRSSATAPPSRERSQVEVFVEEDSGIRPRVVAIDPDTKRKIVLFDLNPQFEELALGGVDEIKWKDVNGNEIVGALYKPPDFVSGKRYPLVVQTHGYRPHAFWVDGPYATAFAAQPLASKGIMVLQLPEVGAATPDEGERNLLAIDGGIAYLNRIGIVDTDRVGLIGFSRTSFHVKFVLTHSTFHFAAAIVSDGIDAGYFQFIAFANEAPNMASDAIMLEGAAPFGKGLLAWTSTSPGFLLDKVQTPILIQATRPVSLLGEWEWFSGLSHLAKPVDLLYIPTGAHVLEKPWDRLASLQAAVDWFAFWLRNEEDSAPAKEQQYTRWRNMRQAPETQ